MSTHREEQPQSESINDEFCVSAQDIIEIENRARRQAATESAGASASECNFWSAYQIDIENESDRDTSRVKCDKDVKSRTIDSFKCTDSDSRNPSKNIANKKPVDKQPIQKAKKRRAASRYAEVRPKIDVGRHETNKPKSAGLPGARLIETLSRSVASSSESVVVIPPTEQQVEKETNSPESKKSKPESTLDRDIQRGVYARTMMESEDDAERMETDVAAAQMKQPQTSSQQPGPESEFISPTRAIKLSQIMKTPPIPPTQTRNRYEILSKQLTETETETEIRRKAVSTSQTKKQTKQRNDENRKKLPPPIVLKGRPTSHRELVQDIQAHIKKGFEIKYAPRSVLLYIKDENEYKTYKNKLINTHALEFHTYSLSNEKKHAFVLRGLQGDIPTDDIKAELEGEYDLAIQNIYKMKTNYSPLYLVITESTVTLKDLQAKIKTLNYTKISWERRTNERAVVQCRRCQMWGHAQSNCHRKPACVKCAGPHWSWECTKPREEEPECANCGGNHTASSTECPAYQIKARSLERQQPSKQKVRYVDAPAPKQNAWDRRTASAAVTETPKQSTSAGGGADAPTDTSYQPTNSQQQRRPRQQPTQTVRGSESACISLPQNSSEIANDLANLNKELSTLNSMIDLKETVRALARLNDKIKNCNTQMEVVLALQNFSQEIENYNIFK